MNGLPKEGHETKPYKFPRQEKEKQEMGEESFPS